MAGKKSARSLHAFIYRSLAVRLALAGTVIALVFGALAYVTQFEDISDYAVIDARNRLQLLLYSTRAVAARENVPYRQAFEKTLAEGAPVRFQQPYGQFVYGRFYSSEGESKGAFKLSGHPRIESVQNLVESKPRRFPAPQQLWEETFRIDRVPHLHFVAAIISDENQMLGYGDVVFALSREAVSEARVKALRAMIYVLLIILTATMLLYPVILTLTRRLARYSETLLTSNLESLSLLGSAIAKRDSDTDAHNYRVTIYAVRIAEAIGMPAIDIQRLIIGSFLHDVGKIGIRDNILLKPGRLDEDEYRIMKTHVDHGRDIINRSKWLQEAGEVVVSHHEKYDGSGYPQGLREEKIPLSARIFALGDVFDALTSRRPYKQPLSLEETMRIMEQGRSSHFDPGLLDLFAGLAPVLYSDFSGSGDEKLHKTLEEIVRRYFTAGMDTLTY